MRLRRRTGAWMLAAAASVAVTVALGWTGVRATHVEDPTPRAPVIVESITWLESASAPPTTAASGSRQPVIEEALLQRRRALTAALRRRLSAVDRKLIGVMTPTGEPEEVARFADDANRHPDLVQVAVEWDGSPFDPTKLDETVRHGAIPILGWEPWDHTLVDEPADQPEFALDRILAGDFDDYVDDWAAGLASLEYPVLLRFGHEMNGDWYPWAEGVNGNEVGSFVRAWRYLRGRFMAAGADNVLWVWSPNTIQGTDLPLAQVWPGEGWVDVVGVVGYFWHVEGRRGESPSFDGLFGATLEEIAGLTDRPVLITETAGTEVGGRKAVWIHELLSSVAIDPRIIGLVWFDVVKETDWRVRSSPESIWAFRRGLSNPAFGGPG